MPRFAVASVAFLMCGLASLALWLGREDTQVAPPPSASPTALDGAVATAGAVYSAKFADIDGKPQTLGQWENRLLVVNFWATWCGPCKTEIPILMKLQETYGAENLQIVGIAADSLSNISNFAKSAPINYPVLLDEAGAIEFSKRLGNRLGLLPHTVVFRPGGEIIYNHLGVISEAEMVAIILENRVTVSKSN